MIKHLPNFDKKILALFLVCLSISGLTIFQVYQAVATPAPTRNTTVEPGTSGYCRWSIFLDGTTPVAHPSNGDPNSVGTAAQGLDVFLNSLSTTTGRICFEPGTYTFNAQWPTCCTDLSSLTFIVGQGNPTSFIPGGAANFDPVNVTAVQARDFQMTDKNGVVVSLVCDTNCQRAQIQAFTLDLRTWTQFAGATYVLFGNYIRLTYTGASTPALRTGYAVVPHNDTNPYWTLRASTVERSFTLINNWYPLFFEPAKGNFANFMGFYYSTTTDLQCLGRLGGAQTAIDNTVSSTFMQSDHTYEVRYSRVAAGATPNVQCVVDGLNFGTVTTNVYQYPNGATLGANALGPEIECCEPGGQAQVLYLKAPFIYDTT